MSYASACFAHVRPSAINKLQVVQNRFMRIATGAPWYLRNSDLHRDLQLPTIAAHFKMISKRFFDTASIHPNPLVIQASNYSPSPNSKLGKRRPKDVLLDPDDQITTDNTNNNPNNTPDIRNTHRLRRRRRGPVSYTSLRRSAVGGRHVFNQPTNTSTTTTS
ncbi:unnamed protein product [Danaus chrysippus]|uniref:(African queen) hypothetical protein n=1 Tax=Danaus chrysippus TaxID=151541 RepID=A0A8J2MIC6_9NEOP|nr:unnamed protein product [Danaus chrysippus]